MKRLFLSLFLILGTFSASFAANNATDVYLLAQANSVDDLKSVENIDVVDSDGNTALCSAIKNNDIKTYNVLKQAGANTEHECVKKIPAKQYQAFTQKLAATNKSWSFLGLGKWAWTAIGVGVVAGAGAAALGGGGGSSGGQSCSGVYVSDGNGGCKPRDCSDYPYTFMGSCPAGWTVGDRCESTDGVHFKCNVMNICPSFYQTENCAAGFVESDTCQSGDTMYRYCLPTQCPYSTTSCSTGFHETGNTCLSGETLYKECEADTCDGYNYTHASECPSGYTTGSSCLSGSTMKYMCNELIQCPYNTQSCGTGYTQTGNICQSGTDVYVECEPVNCPYDTTSCTAGFHETGNTCLSGEILYKECEADTCDGYNYTNANECPTGYTIGSSCLAGTTMKYKCDNDAYCSYNTTECTGGYEETENTCQSGETTYVQCRKISCTGSNALWTPQGCSCKNGYENYVPGDGCSLIPINCGPNAHQSGINCICDDGYTDFRGYDIGCVTRTYYIESIDEQEYNIQNDTDYNLKVGFNSIAYNSSNIYGDTNTAVQKTLNVINNGNGDISFPHYNLTHAYLYETPTLNLVRTANGTLYLENTGHGTIYGLVGSNYEGGNSHVGLDIDNGVSGATVQTDSLLKIKNIGDGDVYGMYGKKMTNADMTGTVSSSVGVDAVSNGTINIENHGDGNVYGIYDTDTTTKVNSTIYNAYSDTQVTTQHYYPKSVNGTIIISNDGDGDVYGMYSHNKLYAARAQIYQRVTANSVISITNNGAGNVYGMYSDTDVVPEGVASSSIISVYNSGSGSAYGIYSGGTAYLDTNLSITNAGSGIAYGAFGTCFAGSGDDVWHILNLSSGTAFGIYGTSMLSSNPISMYNVANGDIIGAAGLYHTSVIGTYYNLGNGWVVGVYGQNTNVWSTNIDRQELHLGANNYAPSSDVGGTAIGGYATSSLSASGPITINKASTAYGIFGDAGASMQANQTNTITINNADLAIGIYIGENGTLTNTGNIAIDNATNAYGIYAASNSNVTNSGNITITNSTNAYGIYAEEGATISNTGIISINGSSCNGSQCDGSETYSNNIVLNGASLINSSTITAKILDLDAINGNVVAGLGAQFIIENELSGDLNISSELVQNGNQTTYIAQNMIDAGDVSGLNVRSASAMFDASLADNGHDVIMQMKDFNELTDNASLAAFLKNNYTNGNGAELFSTLKSMDNMSAFNSALSGFAGLNTFTQFAHEDLSAMREISFSMNNKLFENSSRDSFDISDSTGHFSFSNSHNGGSGQYGISSDKISDNWKLGYGMAMANINTGNGDSMHRQNNLWLFYMPATYTNDGYELVIAPKAGFAHSEYNRRGYNNINYEGYIEKRIFGLMNDLRYPVTFGNWTFAPDLAFNTIVYEQSGREDEQAFSLIIPDDRTISVETGLGFYTKYEKQLSNGGKFKLNSGLMLYREFGDTYDIKLGIRGMDGTFSLYNNDYEYRGAASLGFDYTTGHLHLYGNAQYFMDNANYMNFKGGVSYRF